MNTNYNLSTPTFTNLYKLEDILSITSKHEFTEPASYFKPIGRFNRIVKSKALSLAENKEMKELYRNSTRDLILEKFPALRIWSNKINKIVDLFHKPNRTLTDKPLDCVTTDNEKELLDLMLKMAKEKIGDKMNIHVNQKTGKISKYSGINSYTSRKTGNVRIASRLQPGKETSCK